jgi:hypothetical protein
MINLVKKGKEISPKAEARIISALAAIEQANPSIDWDKYKAYVIVRKFSRWRILDIFPVRRVFLDLVDKSEINELNIPAGTFGDKPWKKKGLGGRPMWCFRLNDLEAKKRSGKIHIKMKGE